MYIRCSGSGRVCAEHSWAGSVSGRGSADTWLSESQRAARSFSLVKVNGRFFNLRERERERHRGREEAVREREQRETFLLPTHCTAHRACYHGNCRPWEQHQQQPLRKCCMHVCVCVCVCVCVYVYLLSLRFRTRSLVICPISSGRNSSLLDRSDITVTFLQLPIWNARNTRAIRPHYSPTCCVTDVGRRTLGEQLTALRLLLYNNLNMLSTQIIKYRWHFVISHRRTKSSSACGWWTKEKPCRKMNVLLGLTREVEPSPPVEPQCPTWTSSKG